MVDGGKGEGGGEQASPPSTAARHGTTLRPRASVESVFSGGYSPGPMALLSNFYGDGDECKSFSELLAGAMVDPTAPSPMPTTTFTLPPGFIDSPSQGQFGITHQQMLAQISSQAVQTHSEHPFSISAVSATSSCAAQQLIPPSMPDSKVKESLDYSHSEQKLQSSVNVDNKPNNDGYNWRKYGQKHVKGSDFSRSYYKCTRPNCPVKKKLERSLEGHVTAIIYKGEHNHQRPHRSKIVKETQTSNENSVSKMDLGSSQATGEHGSGTSDSEEVDDHETEADEKNDEPDAKRRNTEARIQDPATLHRSVAEPRIIVQTTSEVNLLDDGYRWRKYGQKVVKGNPYPRSYYKCTTQGCKVRKHVERASMDPKAVITTYEGKHNHDVPAAKTNSHTLANNSASQLKAQKFAIPDVKHSSSSRGVTGNEQRPVASLRLKEEQIT
ncbi:probable WRKY transcription factor 3 [Glycine soja]|uniref:Putative WRKY transcription factor 3 n=1 Tax=Glycine soja TaxID=3848 RepID=A0A0B2NVY0_GLYSO|nr:probable WRKY transcription factor 3 [Glycine soja]KAG4909033.1 hypothetical protein JHK87_055149 [Glycine soja]KHM99433.1 Putative WRKY transcription factor 3 [Glycine soja]RZB42164.1 putative WRKY transcription factor 3 [Glycine soja]